MGKFTSGLSNIKSQRLRITVFLCSVVLFCNSKAETDTLVASGLIYKNAHHFIPTFSVQILPRGIFYNRQGNFDVLSIKPGYNTAIDFGYDYNYSINPLFAVGAGFRVKYFSYHYRFSSPDMLPEYGCCRVTYFTLYNISFDIPLQSVFRFPFKQKYAFRLVGGPAFRFLMHLDDNAFHRFSEQQYLALTFNPTPIQNAWMVDAHAAFGFEMQTKKYHLLYLQAGVNFCFFRRVLGTYQLVNGEDMIQQGMYRQNLSHMELRLGYVFTGARKKLRRAGLLPPGKVAIHWGK